MATLIAVYDSSGCVGRCDARCYSSHSSRCTCVCGGRNHGVGRDCAVENTRLYATEMIERWKQEHPECECNLVELTVGSRPQRRRRQRSSQQNVFPGIEV